MDTINFSQFNTRSPLNTGDFLVGYDSVLLTEFKTQIKDLIDRYTKKQNLSFNENNQILSVSNANGVSLSTLDYPQSRSTYTTVLQNSGAWGGNLPIKIINTLNYTLSSSDVNRLLVFDTPTITFLEIPDDNYINVPAGATFEILRYGEGYMSLSAGDNVAIRSPNFYRYLKSQFSHATLIKLGINDWQLYGDLDVEPPPTPTPTNTITPTQTQTPTNTQTQTSTQTETPTPTPTITQTPTKTPSQTPSQTAQETPTPTATPTLTKTPTQTPTNTLTPTQTETPTRTPTQTISPTETPTQTASQTPTETVTPTQTPTNTPTNSLTPSQTPTNTPSNTLSQTPTVTQTPTITPTVTLPINTGEDYAINYIPTWDNGEDQGTGFDGWNFSNNAAIGGTVGQSLGSSAINMGNIDTGGVSFLMFANPSNPGPTNEANSRRNIETDLAIGSALSARISVAYRNGYKGLSVHGGSTWTNEIWNINIGADQYQIDGVDLGIPYIQESIFDVYLFQTQPNQFVARVERNNVLVSQKIKSGRIRGLRFYIGDTDPGGDTRNNLYFNRFRIYQYGNLPTGNFEYITNNDQSLNITNPANYIIVDENVSKFTLLLDSISGAVFTNFYDANNLNNCKLNVVSNVHRISTNKSEIFFGQSMTLSAVSATVNPTNLYTLSYFNTGSLILGMANSTIELSAIASYPAPSPTPTPTITQTQTPTNTNTPTVTPPSVDSGEDIASNYIPTWIGNQGTGFGFWGFTTIFDPGGQTGHILGSSSSIGNIDTSGVSFMMFANPSSLGSGNESNATRNLASNLAVGYALSATISVAFRNGYKGFSVHSGTSWANEIWNINIGGNQYQIDSQNLPIDYIQNSVFNIYLYQINSTEFVARVDRNGVLVDQRLKSGVIRGLRFYIGDTDAGGDPRNNLYINSFKIFPIDYPSISPTPTPTLTPTNTETPTQTPTNTETPTQTLTPTQTPTPSLTPEIVIAEDNAANSAYSNGLQNNDNGGFGFNPWIVTIQNNAGTFVESSRYGNINSSSVSWGASAQPETGANFINLRRNLTVPLRNYLSNTYAFSAQITTRWRNGNKGFDIYDDSNVKAFNFTVRSVGGNDRYEFNGQDTGWPYSDSAIFNIYVSTTFNGFNVTVTYGANTSSFNYPIGPAIGFRRFNGIEFYVAQTETGDNNRLYFNNFKVYRSS